MGDSIPKTGISFGNGVWLNHNTYDELFVDLVHVLLVLLGICVQPRRNPVGLVIRCLPKENLNSKVSDILVLSIIIGFFINYLWAILIYYPLYIIYPRTRQILDLKCK